MPAIATKGCILIYLIPGDFKEERSYCTTGIGVAGRGQRDIDTSRQQLP